MYHRRESKIWTTSFNACLGFEHMRDHSGKATTLIWSCFAQTFVIPAACARPYTFAGCRGFNGGLRPESDSFWTVTLFRFYLQALLRIKAFAARKEMIPDTNNQRKANVRYRKED